MHLLCQSILDQSNKIPTPDLTQHITNPTTVGLDNLKATIQVLDMKQEPVLCKKFPDKINKQSVLTTSSFKIVDYDEDRLAGLAVLTNKQMRTMVLYNVGFDCNKLTELPDEPYKVELVV